jgi:hypothetical protein
VDVDEATSGKGTEKCRLKKSTLSPNEDTFLWEGPCGPCCSWSL